MQRLKRAVKRIAAIGTGVAMLGATMTGALAQPDMADYPSPFIVDGKDSGNIAIVVGAEARSADTIGALDIAKQLQFDSKVCAADAASSGSVTVSGDAVEISHSSDLLELRETIGDVRETLTDVEVAGGGLASGKITTDEGSTEFNQYLRFTDNSDAIGYSPRVNFTESEGILDGYVGDYLYIQDSDNTANASTSFFEYEIEFESGLESAVSSSTLPDLEDEELLILGTTYTIVDTTVDTVDDDIKLTLLGGAVYDILGEGETKTYNIDGKDFEVTVMIIEDVTPATVTFDINGEITRQLQDSETTTLDDGTLLGISDIILNEAGEAGSGDIVEMYLGATKLTLEDTDYNDAGWYNGVEIDNDNIENANVMITAAELSSGTIVEISSIKYRLSAQSMDGVDIWVEPGHGVREYLDEPQGLLGTEWDLRYEGLDDIQTSIIKLDPMGDDDYNLIFENRQGLVYNVPFITNEAGTFKYGNDNRDFVFIEGNYSANGNSTGNQPTVGHLDYFVLSDADTAEDNDAISHVLRYDSYDSTNNELQFEDMATGDTKEVTYTTKTAGTANGTLGVGDLIIGGTTYKVHVANASSGTPPLIIDMDADGIFDKSEIKLTVNGGGILDLGLQTNSVGGTWSTTDTVPENVNGTWVNDGINISAVQDEINISLSTLAEDFDEDRPETVGGTTATKEWTNITIEDRTNNELGLRVSTLLSNGGIGSLIEDADNDDYLYGMTDFGALWTVYDPWTIDNPETLTIEYPLAQRGVRVYFVEDINDFINDVQAPDVTIISPVDYIEYNTTTINFDMLAFDNVAIDSRWYDYDGTNVTFNGSINLVYPSQGTYQITAYANDTSGNLGMETVTFDIVFSDLPDLYIDSVIYTPNNPQVGDEITINLTLANGGTVPVSGFNWIYDWNHGIGTNSFTLNSGESLNLSFRHTYTLGGDYTFYFEVDPTNNITELNENNNILLLDLFVDGTPELEPKLISKKKDSNNRNKVVYKYKIKNTGNVYVENLDYDVNFGDGSGNGGFIGEKINPGSFYLLTLEHEYVTAGLYNSSLVVDSFNFFDELNETNNEVLTSVWIPCDKSNGVKSRCLAKRR